MVGFDVSPDGRTVAFAVQPWSSSTWDAPPNTETTATIYFTPIDGSAAARPAWTITGVAPNLLRFSPDGQWLLGSTQTGFVVRPVDGGDPIVSDRFAPYGARGAQWSPDGTHIAIGEHFERSCCGATSLLGFDASHPSLRAMRASTSILGTAPWYSADGALHAVTDPSLVCTGPMDIDASFRWALSATDGCSGVTSDLAWWPASTGPADARPLGLRLPSGTFFGAAW
jgi:hypothetical protein